jgi:hypothetical protein
VFESPHSCEPSIKEYNINRIVYLEHRSNLSIFVFRIIINYINITTNLNPIE